MQGVGHFCLAAKRRWARNSRQFVGEYNPPMPICFICAEGPQWQESMVMPKVSPAATCGREAVLPSAFAWITGGWGWDVSGGCPVTPDWRSDTLRKAGSFGRRGAHHVGSLLSGITACDLDIHIPAGLPKIHLAPPGLEVFHCGPIRKLVGRDACVRCRKWKLISHPDTTNPFVASFVNYRCTCRLYPITVGGQTFFDWKGEGLLHLQSAGLWTSYCWKELDFTKACFAGEFYTDPHHVTGMQVGASSKHSEQVS